MSVHKASRGSCRAIHGLFCVASEHEQEARLTSSVALVNCRNGTPRRLFERLLVEVAGLFIDNRKTIPSGNLVNLPCCRGSRGVSPRRSRVWTCFSVCVSSVGLSPAVPWFGMREAVAMCTAEIFNVNFIRIDY